MKKLLPILMLLSIAYLIGCQERGMKRPFSYVFWIKDSVGVNLVGDSSNPNRYFADSIKYNYILNGVVMDTLENKLNIYYNYYKGYFLSSLISTNKKIIALLTYNKNERDTIRLVYGKDNINVYKNNILIFSKYNLSQVPPVEFNIIK